MTRYSLFLAPALLAVGLVGCKGPDCCNTRRVGHSFGDDGLVERTSRRPAPSCPTCGRNVAWPINGHVDIEPSADTPPIRVQAAKPRLPSQPDSMSAPPDSRPISPYAPLRSSLDQSFGHDAVLFTGPLPTAR